MLYRYICYIYRPRRRVLSLPSPDARVGGRRTLRVGGRMLYSYTCYTVIHVIQLYMLYSYTCYTVIHVIQLYMLYSYTCYTVIHVIQLYMLYSDVCYTVIYVIQ
jgi:hypothetical protein